MILSWFRSRRRRAVLERPFPASWDASLRRHLRQFDWLADDERERLRGWIAVFLDEKRFEGCGGMEITDEVRVAIAAQAGLAALGFTGEFFAPLLSVLVYPGDYVGPRSTPLAGGGALEWREARLGETWAGGSMVLSWPRVVDGGRMRDGPRSVVMHEIAHLLDLQAGGIDGSPPLPTRAARQSWDERMGRCRDRFEEALDEGRSVPFDDYAAESPAEFFAVASECFFQDPHRLLRHDRTLYDLLAEAWRQDPRSRVPARVGRG